MSTDRQYNNIHEILCDLDTGSLDRDVSIPGYEIQFGEDSIKYKLAGAKRFSTYRRKKQTPEKTSEPPTAAPVSTQPIVPQKQSVPEPVQPVPEKKPKAAKPMKDEAYWEDHYRMKYATKQRVLSELNAKPVVNRPEKVSEPSVPTPTPAQPSIPAPAKPVLPDISKEDPVEAFKALVTRFNTAPK